MHLSVCLFNFTCLSLHDFLVSTLHLQELCLHCIQQCPEDVNAQENAGFTPLHEACSIGHIVIARMLLAHGARVNVSSHDGIR